MNIVVDTNILVSALWSPGRQAFQLISHCITGAFTLCYHSSIAEEYIRVLHYPKFGFSESEISAFLNPLLKNGICVIPPALNEVVFSDPSDRIFYEVAKYCNAPLITGNSRHFPKDNLVVSLSDFCADYL